jgi:glucosamine-6-phosphate deaminase
MFIVIKDDYQAVSAEAAGFLVERLLRKPDLVLGLATGSTPIGLYRELIRRCREDGLDVSKITTFNLDEYVGVPPDHEQSYHRFMKEQLFDHLGLDPRYVYIPNGMANDIEAHCDWYEQQIQRAGGIDVQILGMGSNGHIAFNEPGSSLGSRTRVKTLTQETRDANARFFSSAEEVPRHAITMGIGTIMEARELVMLVTGESKAEALRAAVEGPLTAQLPASMIQMHRKAYVIVDRAAAHLLRGEHAGSIHEASLVRRPLPRV